jgi:hypothetical protein
MIRKMIKHIIHIIHRSVGLVVEYVLLRAVVLSDGIEGWCMSRLWIIDQRIVVLATTSSHGLVGKARD